MMYFCNEASPFSHERKYSAMSWKMRPEISFCWAKHVSRENVMRRNDGARTSLTMMSSSPSRIFGSAKSIAWVLLLTAKLCKVNRHKLKHSKYWSLSPYASSFLTIGMLCSSASCSVASCGFFFPSGVRLKTMVNGRVSKNGWISSWVISVMSVPLTSTSSSPSIKGSCNLSAGESGTTASTCGGTSQRIFTPRGGTSSSSKTAVTYSYSTRAGGAPPRS
mmetsp:Transcript_56837/g.173066  ORF Transcript_56837/g.173066 Transcript_56837/m.173066 type:complete len:220 (-) Transcript_56837:4089-4748(-)